MVFPKLPEKHPPPPLVENRCPNGPQTFAKGAWTYSKGTEPWHFLPTTLTCTM